MTIENVFDFFFLSNVFLETVKGKVLILLYSLDERYSQGIVSKKEKFIFLKGQKNRFKGTKVPSNRVISAWEGKFVIIMYKF